MLKRVWQELTSKNEDETLFQTLVESIGDIRNQSDVLAICPNNTGSSWLGIKNGTELLFPENTVALPQYYSQTKLTAKQLEELCRRVAELNFRLIVFRGFPPYFVDIFKKIKASNKSTALFLLFAGSASEYYMEEHRQKLTLAVELCRAGVLNKLGFNKKGLPESITTIFKVPTGLYRMKCVPPIVGMGPKNRADQVLKIGVLGGDTFNKNLHTQAIAAMALDNSELHVLDKSNFDYLGKERIVYHKSPMEHKQFLEVLAVMDVNYYLCFSESWGHVVTESLSVGTPCLTTASSGIFDLNEELKAALVVNDYDDIAAIIKQTKLVLENYDYISKRGLEYIGRLNKYADECNNRFWGSNIT